MFYVIFRHYFVVKIGANSLKGFHIKSLKQSIHSEAVQTLHKKILIFQLPKYFLEKKVLQEIDI